jgi:hypothetical protein
MEFTNDGSFTNGMFLSEVKGHSLHKNIEIRGWLEQVSAQVNVFFKKRITKNKR